MNSSSKNWLTSFEVEKVARLPRPGNRKIAFVMLAFPGPRELYHVPVMAHGVDDTIKAEPVAIRRPLANEGSAKAAFPRVHAQAPFIDRVGGHVVVVVLSS